LSRQNQSKGLKIPWSRRRSNAVHQSYQFAVSYIMQRTKSFTLPLSDPLGFFFNLCLIWLIMHLLRWVILSGRPQASVLSAVPNAETSRQACIDMQQISDPGRSVDEWMQYANPKESPRNWGGSQTSAENPMQHAKSIDLEGVSIESVVDSFIANTKWNPDYVCTSCHRLMYK